MKTVRSFSLLIFLTFMFGNAYAASCLAQWCSRLYTYQEKVCKTLINCSYDDTDYTWCVQKWGFKPKDTYGELEVWDDDRIKADSGTLKSKKCKNRMSSCRYETIQLDLSEAYRC